MLELEWTIETMRLVNELTPDIKGKAFNPDWFLLRQRFEQIEMKLESAERERDDLQKRLQQQGNEKLEEAARVVQSEIDYLGNSPKMSSERGALITVRNDIRALKTPEQHTQQSTEQLHGDLTAPVDATTRVLGDVESKTP